jgi:hypothetical protein
VHKTRSAKTRLQRTWQLVPVIGIDRKPLMPTNPRRAERWILSRKATPFFSKGVFCVRLNVPTKTNIVQEVAVGIDPGSKREAFTVKSEAHTYLNVLTDTVGWVKNNVETRRMIRRSRRNRKTPCRQNRMNRHRGGIPPSTKARWQLKLRITNWLSKIYPISGFVVEDIKAKTKGKKRWDSSFSPLEVGKQWFYKELEKYGKVYLRQGYETKELRDQQGLYKSKSKMSESFDAHNVDSFVLANYYLGISNKPDNTEIFRIFPLQFHRRQLHVLNPTKGNIRRNYGGTRSLGFKRGSIVRHKKHGICFVGGSSKGKISLHNLKSGERRFRNISVEDVKFLSYNSFGTCGNSSHA